MSLHGLTCLTCYVTTRLAVRVIYTWTGTGTHDGPLATAKGIIPPTGKKGSIDGVLIATIKEGKIVREETYWNVPDLLAQLGLM